MLILTKISESDYIEDMYQNEYLYFKSLKDFRSADDDKSGRLDPKELNLKNVQLATLTLTVNSKELHLHEILKEFSGQLMEHLAEPKVNCCSLHWFEIEPEKISSTFHEKLLDIGDKAMIILDWEKFFEILDYSLESLGLDYSRKKVTYYDPKKFNGEITLHHKDEKYKYQNEYRILIAPTDNMPKKIPLPGLKKISHIIESRDLAKLRIEIKK